jgi:cytochrome P450
LFIGRLLRWGRQALFDPGRGLLFRLLRRYKPVLVFGGRRGGFAIVLRYADVTEVYSRDEVFSVRLYGHRMAETTGPFILGMDSGPQYDREDAIVRAVVRRDDVERVRRFAEAQADAIVARVLGERGRIDVVADLALLVQPAFLADYHGFDGVDPQTAVRWFRTSAFYVFNFWPGSWLQAPAIDAAGQIVAHLEERLATRLAERAQRATDSGAAARDDVLERLLDLRERDPQFALADADLVRTMAGLVSGSVEPGISSFTYLIDALLDRPHLLRELHAAARDGAYDVIRSHLLEAARFGCYPPGLSRYCRRDHTFGIGTRWERRIAAGTTVIPLQASAMFDSSAVERPMAFDPHRAPEFYRNFGSGAHRCIGEELGKALWVGMATPLLRLTNLRRAPGGNAFVRKGRRFDFPEAFYVQHLEVTAD